jgi:hypothetical protein
MPSRKQRRRREKELRHEYEIVWEDAEGNELDPDEAPSNGSSKKSASPTRAGRGRQIQPPSWRRTLKRGLVFAPIMLVTVLFLSKGHSTAQVVLQTALIIAIFIPFSYLLDGFFWRAQQRRAAREQARKRG